MHDELTVVTERGQTSIPAALRSALKLKRGTRLQWEQLSEGELRVRIVRPRRKIDPMAMIGFGADFPTAEPSDRYMKRMREGE